MPKLDRTFRRIYNLSLPKPRRGLSVNAAILEAHSTLAYSTIDDILALILLARRGTISNGNNQLVSYDYIILYRNITNPIIIAPANYIT